MGCGSSSPKPADQNPPQTQKTEKPGRQDPKPGKQEPKPNTESLGNDTFSGAGSNKPPETSGSQINVQIEQQVVKENSGNAGDVATEKQARHQSGVTLTPEGDLPDGESRTDGNKRPADNTLSANSPRNQTVSSNSTSRGHHSKQDRTKLESNRETESSHNTGTKQPDELARDLSNRKQILADSSERLRRKEEQPSGQTIVVDVKGRRNPAEDQRQYVKTRRNAADYPRRDGSRKHDQTKGAYPSEQLSQRDVRQTREKPRETTNKREVAVQAVVIDEEFGEDCQLGDSNIMGESADVDDNGGSECEQGMSGIMADISTFIQKVYTTDNQTNGSLRSSKSFEDNTLEFPATEQNTSTSPIENCSYTEQHNVGNELRKSTEDIVMDISDIGEETLENGRETESFQGELTDNETKSTENQISSVSDKDIKKFVQECNEEEGKFADKNKSKSPVNSGALSEEEEISLHKDKEESVIEVYIEPVTNKPEVIPDVTPEVMTSSAPSYQAAPHAKKKAAQASSWYDDPKERAQMRRIRLRLRDATMGNDLDELDEAIWHFETYQLVDNGDLTSALDRLEFLQLRKDLRDAIVRRNLGILNQTIGDAHVSGCENELRPLLTKAEEIRDHLQALNNYSHDILGMDQKLISEIRSYCNPPPSVHEVMAACYMLMGVKEQRLLEWSEIQSHVGRLGRTGLRNMLLHFDPDSVPLETLLRVKEILNFYHLEDVRAASNGAASFYLWAKNMVDLVDRRRQQETTTERQKSAAKKG